MHTLSVFYLALLLSSCGSVSNSQQAKDVDLSAKELKAIREQLANMENLCKKNDMLGIARIYLDNAYLISPGGLKVTGRDEIDKYWKSIKDPIDWKLDLTAASKDENKIYESEHWKNLQTKPPGWKDLGLDTKDVIYQLGTSTLKYKWQGKEQTSIVNYILLWKKQPDGRYRILVDTYVG